jgi:hypothetical protein
MTEFWSVSGTFIRTDPLTFCFHETTQHILVIMILVLKTKEVLETTHNILSLVLSSSLYLYFLLGVEEVRSSLKSNDKCSFFHKILKSEFNRAEIQTAQAFLNVSIAPFIGPRARISQNHPGRAKRTAASCSRRCMRDEIGSVGSLAPAALKTPTT